MKNVKSNFRSLALRPGLVIIAVILACQLAFGLDALTNDFVNQTYGTLRIPVIGYIEENGSNVSYVGEFDLPANAQYVYREGKNGLVAYNKFRNDSCFWPRDEYMPDAGIGLGRSESILSRYGRVSREKTGSSMPEWWIKESVSQYLKTNSSLQVTKGIEDRLSWHDRLAMPKDDLDGDGLCNLDEMLALRNPLMADSIAVLPGALEMNPGESLEEVMTNSFTVCNLTEKELSLIVCGDPGFAAESSFFAGTLEEPRTDQRWPRRKRSIGAWARMAFSSDLKLTLKPGARQDVIMRRPSNKCDAMMQPVIIKEPGTNSPLAVLEVYHKGAWLGDRPVALAPLAGRCFMNGEDVELSMKAGKDYDGPISTHAVIFYKDKHGQDRRLMTLDGGKGGKFTLKHGDLATAPSPHLSWLPVVRYKTGYCCGKPVNFSLAEEAKPLRPGQGRKYYNHGDRYYHNGNDEILMKVDNEHQPMILRRPPEDFEIVDMPRGLSLVPDNEFSKFKGAPRDPGSYIVAKMRPRGVGKTLFTVCVHVSEDRGYWGMDSLLELDLGRMVHACDYGRSCDCCLDEMHRILAKDRERTAMADTNYFERPLPEGLKLESRTNGLFVAGRPMQVGYFSNTLVVVRQGLKSRSRHVFSIGSCDNMRFKNTMAGACRLKMKNRYMNSFYDRTVDAFRHEGEFCYWLARDLAMKDLPISSRGEIEEARVVGDMPNGTSLVKVQNTYFITGTLDRTCAVTNNIVLTVQGNVFTNRHIFFTTPEKRPRKYSTPDNLYGTDKRSVNPRYGDSENLKWSMAMEDFLKESRQFKNFSLKDFLVSAMKGAPTNTGRHAVNFKWLQSGSGLQADNKAPLGTLLNATVELGPGSEVTPDNLYISDRYGGGSGMRVGNFGAMVLEAPWGLYMAVRRGTAPFEFYLRKGKSSFGFERPLPEGFNIREMNREQCLCECTAAPGVYTNAIYEVSAFDEIPKKLIIHVFDGDEAD